MQPSREYRSAIRHLYGLAKLGMRLDLERMTHALALCGNPHDGLRYVHVGGTNGKGSVSAMVEAGLRAAGYRTGLYTSPHLHRFVERIRVGGRPISERSLARHFRDVQRAVSGPDAPPLTFFEMTTLIAFSYFRAAKCDVVVLEVGLGGRLDATNVVRPDVCVITSIARDHEEQLGSTLRSIAEEKAGILKRGAAAVIGVRDAEPLAVIEQRAHERGVATLVIGRDFDAKSNPRSGSIAVRVGERTFGRLHPALGGAHQLDNVASALCALCELAKPGFHIPLRAMRHAVEQVRWPGRLELVRGKPNVLLDASHNPDGCFALAEHLQTIPRSGKRALVFGAMSDKDYTAMLRALGDGFDERFYVATKLGRAASPARFVDIVPGRVARSVAAGLRSARRAVGPRGLVVVAGSIFVMAEARAILRNVRTDPPIAL